MNGHRRRTMTIQLERPGNHAQALRSDPISLLGRRTEGYSLEAPFYTGQEVYDLDMEAIWTKHWLFVAAEAELPEPGDYVTVNVGRTSVIIVRDDDEQVQAFHN